MIESKIDLGRALFVYKGEHSNETLGEGDGQTQTPGGEGNPKKLCIYARREELTAQPPEIVEEEVK